MRCLGFVVIAACGYPALPPVPGQGGEIDAGAPSVPPVTAELLAGDIGGPGNLDAMGAAARFSSPADLAVDSAGNVYVSDEVNNAIRQIRPTGQVVTYAGSPTSGEAPGSADGTGTAARFRAPLGIAVSADNQLFIADSGNHTIRRVVTTGAQSQVVTTLAGSAGNAGSTNGAGAAARFNTPIGIVASGTNTLFVADSFNHTIRQITVSTGQVATVAGAPGVAGSADGASLTAAHFNFPSGIVMDGAGAVFVADTGNHTIRKIANNAVATFAGAAGVPGNVDATGVNARFNAPSDLAIDAAGNLYVADKGNHTIRKNERRT